MRRLIQSDPVYAAMIERLDWNIGRLMTLISELELEENTIVIFFSDNGGLATAEGSPTCNKPLSEGKGWMKEGGTRVPLIIKWPRELDQGIESDLPIISTDFYPTILEMVGLPLKPNQHVDGLSLIPLLKDGTPYNPRPLFFHYPHYSNQGESPGSSVRLGNHKLIEHFETNEHELYDLENDVGEERNLIQEKPSLAEKLIIMLEEWREEIDARMSKPNPHYDTFLRDLFYKIIAFGYKVFTVFSPKFRKMRRSLRERAH